MLKAKKLRLGGKVSAPKKKYDFETALNRSFSYIKNPLQKWKKGDLKERQLVLRIVFEDALIYDKETGFETAKLSLPVELSCIPELDRLEMVELRGVEPLTSSMPWKRSSQLSYSPNFFMVRPAGFEPTTSRSAIWRSSRLNYGRTRRQERATGLQKVSGESLSVFIFDFYKLKGKTSIKDRKPGSPRN